MRKLLLFCCLLGLGALIFALGPRGYHRWRSEKSYRNAVAAASQNRTKEAILSLQEALQSDPGHLPATKLMAELLAAKGSPAAMLWHRRLAQIAPEAIDAKLAWLRDALARRDAAMAAAALESFNDSQKNRPEFHHLASAEALLRKDWKAAGFHASEALRLDPEDPVLQLNLASVQLQSGNPAMAAQARNALAALQQKEKTSVAATRVLILDALRRNDFSQAATLSRILLPSSSAGFNDRIHYLSALEGLKSPELAGELKTAYSLGSSDSGSASLLLEWLLQHRRAAEARDWLGQLPPVMLQDPILRVLRATADAETGQWEILQARLGNETWEDMDFLRQAFLARACKESGLDAKS